MVHSPSILPLSALICIYIFVIETPLPCPFPFNSFVYADNLDAFTRMTAEGSMPEKALLFTTVSHVDFIVTVDRALHTLKALLPIVVNPAPMVTLVSFVSPLKASCLIVVTVFGIVML